MKCKFHRQFEGQIRSATISKGASGKYYISILVDIKIIPLLAIEKAVGVDLGIKDFAITSDEEIFENPKFLRKLEYKLVRSQRSLLQQ